MVFVIKNFGFFVGVKCESVIFKGEKEFGGWNEMNVVWGL